jgi:sugar phosphate isomerase/epimerase
MALSPVLMASRPPGGVSFSPSNRLKTSLNAYSFNEPLLKGTMSLNDLIGFCADLGFDGVDITGYYFKGYPNVPASEELLEVKRKAFSVGLAISGTGVRNDFTWTDPASRKDQLNLVLQWIEAASRLGAPVLRVFAGTQKVAAEKRDEITTRMIDDLKTCADYGKKHGVIIGLQNHHDYFTTAGEVIDVAERVGSAWMGLIVDTGSFRVNDAYAEIAKSAPYAVNWQVKEKLYLGGIEVEADIQKIADIVKGSPYAGYLPIETLGAGDPKTKVKALLARLTQALNT